jgi:diadenosine tetraphosphate (Ap4A) HIT family hydrolase
MPVIESRLHIPEAFIVHETEHWVINHNFASALPGYLVLGSKAPVDSLADLSPAALHEFGPLLAQAQLLLQQTLEPERIYASRYGHSAGYPIHFHLIPVYPWLQRLFWEDPRYRLLETFANPQRAQTRTDGAELTLFIWREFGEREHPPAIEGPPVAQVIERLRAAFAESCALR